MTIEDVQNNLELTKQTFRKVIVTSNFKKINDSIISWPNYTSGVFRNLYTKEYELVVRNRQYSFLLKEDKGCVQFYYEIRNDGLIKAKLAYYPYPTKLKESSEELESYIYDSEDQIIGEYYYDLWNVLNHQFELNINDEELKKLIKESKARGNDESAENLILNKFESKYEFTNSSHIRIDYDGNVKSHHKCEIQIGAINELRIPSQKIPTPFIFFDFLAKNLYSKEYKEIKSKSNFKTNFTISRSKSLDDFPFQEDNFYVKLD